MGQESDASKGMRIFTIDAGNTIAVSTTTEQRGPQYPLVLNGLTRDSEPTSNNLIFGFGLS